MSFLPAACVCCLAHPTEHHGSPMLAGWKWDSSLPGWVCDACQSIATPNEWDDKTEPNLDPAWLATEKEGEKTAV